METPTLEDQLQFQRTEETVSLLLGPGKYKLLVFAFKFPLIKTLKAREYLIVFVLFFKTLCFK